MNEGTELETRADAPAGYRLGDPIALEDLLALPPDGRRYTRDPEGRLALMAPEDPRWHRTPLSALVTWLVRRTRPPVFVSSEPGIAFSRIWSLDGRLLPPSRLGPKTLEPDVVVFAERPTRFVEDVQGRARGFDPGPLRLAVEVLSPGTHRQDLGLGEADAVDRPRSYLESGVPEYWVLNPHPEILALPPRTGLFLRAAGDRWEPLPGDSRRIESPLLGVVDLDELWNELLPRA